MVKGNIPDRLNLMIAAGHPVFIFGSTVVLPIEAEDFFSDEEIKEVETYILSCR